MVYMGGKAKNNASRSNQITHFGVMGGLAPSTNVAQGVKRFRLRRARNKQTIPLMPIPGLEYMKEKDILSKNPAGSGGVGFSNVLVNRAMGPSGGGDRRSKESTSDTSDCTYDYFEYMQYEKLYFRTGYEQPPGDAADGKYEPKGTAGEFWEYTKPSSLHGKFDVILLRKQPSVDPNDDGIYETRILVEAKRRAGLGV